MIGLGSDKYSSKGAWPICSLRNYRTTNDTEDRLRQAQGVLSILENFVGSVFSASETASSRSVKDARKCDRDWKRRRRRTKLLKVKVEFFVFFAVDRSNMPESATGLGVGSGGGGGRSCQKGWDRLSDFQTPRLASKVNSRSSFDSNVQEIGYKSVLNVKHMSSWSDCSTVFFNQLYNSTLKYTTFHQTFIH